MSVVHASVSACNPQTPERSTGRSAKAESHTTTPIFRLLKQDWSPNKEQGPIMAVGVGNFMMMVGTENGFVVRWNMKTESIESMLRAHTVWLSSRLLSLVAGHRWCACECAYERDISLVRVRVSACRLGIESTGRGSHPSGVCRSHRQSLHRVVQEQHQLLHSCPRVEICAIDQDVERRGD